jgi:tRNA 2-thiouridine synthesizing protein E
MTTLNYSRRRIDLDEDGYLKSFTDWNEDVAHALTEREGVGRLSKDKMDILLFMRDYYTKFNSFPILNAVCRNIHQPKECTYEQFPDPILAWKIAGLPKPTTEVFSLIKHNVR